MQNFEQKPEPFVQNAVSWCWSVAVKIIGMQFLRIYHPTRYHALFPGSQHPQGVPARCLPGARPECVAQGAGCVVVDDWQYRIVTSVFDNVDGLNEAADEQGKREAFGFFLRETAASRAGELATVSCYNYRSGLVHAVFQTGNYILANAVFSPGNVAHTVVLLPEQHSEDIAVYDPWDGSLTSYTERQVFFSGIHSSLGWGTIEWLQVIAGF